MFRSADTGHSFQVLARPAVILYLSRVRGPEDGVLRNCACLAMRPHRHAETHTAVAATHDDHRASAAAVESSKGRIGCTRTYAAAPPWRGSSLQAPPRCQGRRRSGNVFTLCLQSKLISVEWRSSWALTIQSVPRIKAIALLPVKLLEKFVAPLKSQKTRRMWNVNGIKASNFTLDGLRMR